MKRTSKLSETKMVLDAKQASTLLEQLDAVYANKKFAFNEINSPYSIKASNIEGLQQAKNIVLSTVPESTVKNTMIKFLDSETEYFRQVDNLNQQRNVRMKELASTIIGPSGEPIVPFAPIPFSELQLVGWDEKGNEVYYNTDDGYYYKRDGPGSNNLTRYNGTYMDSDGNLHYAEMEANNYTWGQLFHRYFSSDTIHLSDAMKNKLDDKFKDMLRPDSPWFKP